MGEVDDHALPEMQGKSKEHLTGLLERARDIGLLTHHRLDLVQHPSGAALVPAAALRRRSTTGRTVAPALKPRSAPGSRPSASWAITIHEQFIRGQPRRDPVSCAGGGEPAPRSRESPRRTDGGHPVILAMQALALPLRLPGTRRNGLGSLRKLYPTTARGRRTRSRPRRPLQRQSWITASSWALEQERDLAGPRPCRKGRSAWSPAQAERMLWPCRRTPPLDDRQRNRIQALSVCVLRLARILREQGSADCVAHFTRKQLGMLATRQRHRWRIRCPLST